ncbi:hypothetical protein JW766_00350 [Candidatus Dojkabacteria bacterium]|nr:hypothetical protein [Candidatus Dojkabacteria bacterium]
MPEAEAPNNNHVITTGFKDELPYIVGSLLRAAPALMLKPGLTFATARAALSGNWDSSRFSSPDLRTVLSRMSGERTNGIETFPEGGKIIVVNHTTLPAVLAAVARRLPNGESMPFMPSDILSPFNIYTSPEASFFQRQVALRLLQLELTMPFMLATIPLDQEGLRAEILETGGVGGRIYNGKELLQEIGKIQETDQNASFLVFIEHRPSRGRELLPPNQLLVSFTNYLLRTFDQVPLVFMAYNSDTRIGKHRVLQRAELPQVHRMKLKREFYEQQLRELMDMT